MADGAGRDGEDGQVPAGRGRGLPAAHFGGCQADQAEQNFHGQKGKPLFLFSIKTEKVLHKIVHLDNW